METLEGQAGQPWAMAVNSLRVEEVLANPSESA